jgi:hypothetical protein
MVNMLVVHWAKHNCAGRILAHGLIPQRCRTGGIAGVYAYPWGFNKTVSGFWRRTLKSERQRNGRYNGFVFRLVAEDFPLEADDYVQAGYGSPKCRFDSIEQLAKRYGVFWRGRPDNPPPATIHEPNAPFEWWGGFEIIIPRRIEPSRFIKIIRDRPPGKERRALAKAKSQCRNYDED